MVFALQVLVNEVRQQVLEHVGCILQFTLQNSHDQGGDIAAVSHGEASLRLQGSDEGQKENLVVDKLSKQF